MKHSTTTPTEPHVPISPEPSELMNEETEQHKAEDMEERIREDSPDGRPAYPRIRSKEILILAAGSLVAVMAISAATYALWGFDEALLVLGLGMVFAVAGNPVVWAMFFRSKEREELNHEREDHVPLKAKHKPRTR